MDDLYLQLQQEFGSSSYTIKKELLGGGMARVFLARDEALGREIVVKALPPELTFAFSAARFDREIKLAAALQEPHILPLLSSGQTVGGYPYYTMPFVRGMSLRDRIRKGPVPVDECLAILRDVASALACAHKQGIIHRDIKPENILLSEGTAVVTDFGIAKAVQAARREAGRGTREARAQITQPGDNVGTPAYMSPEQAASDPDTDQRADIYAWGVVAYELLTGKHPFAEHISSPQNLLAAQMSDTPRPLMNTGSKVPRPISDLVMVCLSKQKSMRPASGAELLAAIDNPSKVRLPRSAIPSRQRLSVLVTLLIVTLALGGGALWRARAGAEDNPPLIAVLPFETEGTGADPSFADGLRDAVTGKLARLGGLSVIDRKSVSSLVSAGTSAQQMGRSLGADYVLRASVRWAKGADSQPVVRVSPELIRVSDATTRWAGDPEIVSPSDPFTIQSRVATQVAEALNVEFESGERTTMAMRATNDTGAFAALVRGKRIYEENTTASYSEYERALREFEHAYARDPGYADALGLASQALAVMSFSGGTKMLDSAAVIARRALELDPNQPNAVATLAFRGFNRPGEALAIIRRALRANPSSIELLVHEQRALLFVGDSAGAWESVKRVLPLAPASKSVLVSSFGTALALRRFKDAANLLARERALDPTSTTPIFHAAVLAEKLGDTIALGRAVRELRARGGKIGAADGELLRKADRALQNEFATASLASFAPGSALDSVNFYAEKAEFFAGKGDYRRARTLADSAWRLEKRMVDDPNGSAYVRRGQYEVLAWLAALYGDRTLALAMLGNAEKSPTISQYPRGVEAMQLTCTKAAVYGFLGDAETMMPFVRKCFTSANGYAISYLNDPEFAWVKSDPRVRAITESQHVASLR